jgi:hypothetical protein
MGGGRARKEEKGQKMRSKSSFVIVWLLCLLAADALAQIQGKISDKKQQALEFITVVLKNASDSSFVAFTRSNEEGFYLLTPKQPGAFLLVFSSLGYAKQELVVQLEEASALQVINIVMEEQYKELNEVIVRAEREIAEKKDTIVFDAKAFAQGNEEVVEDLLKKIPGLTVEADGTIKVGNQEVEKVMVEGDDFFERGYKLLTKNMPARPIDKIELLQNYSNKRLLKGIEQSERVALNLVLTEEAKSTWFGNIMAGHSLPPESRYELKGNLMNFGKKNKYYFLTNLNNIAYDATGDINQLIRPMRFNEPASIGDNQSLRSLIGLSASPPGFKRSRVSFNDAEMLSLNAILNPSKQFKIKTLGFFNSDELSFFRNRTDRITLNNLDFANSEDYRLRNSKVVGFGKLDLNYDLSDNEALESITKYQNANFAGASQLLFNGQSTVESLQNPLALFDQKLNYTKRFEEGKVFLLTARYIKESAPQQDYHINQFLFEELFPTTQANAVSQQLTQQMTFVGIEGHLLHRKGNEDLMELKIGNAYRQDALNSRFALLNGATTLALPEGFQNQTLYSVNDLYATAKYQYKLKKVALIGNIGLHQLLNTLQEEGQRQRQSPFFINPTIALDWQMNTHNRIRASYGLNRSNAELLQVYDAFVLTGFRNFNSGTGGFNQLDASSAFFNYQLGKFTDRFLANATFAYTKSHDFFSTNSQIRQNFVQTEAILINDREQFIINGSMDYFFKKLQSNLKLKLGYTQSEFKNIVNDSELRQVKSGNYQYGFEVRSAFMSLFNFHTGSQWLYNRIETNIVNSFTDNVSFLDLTFAFSAQFNFSLNAERYYFGNLQNDNTYYFIDLDARYTVKQNKLTLILSGRNLSNTERFRSFAISDIGTSTSEYRLLPRFILLKAEYRF